jgi:hypothetical protein
MAHLSSLHDFGIDVSKLNVERLIGWLQSRIQDLLSEVKASSVWAGVIDDEAPSAQIIRILQCHARR